MQEETKKVMDGLLSFGHSPNDLSFVDMNDCSMTELIVMKKKQVVWIVQNKPPLVGKVCLNVHDIKDIVNIMDENIGGFIDDLNNDDDDDDTNEVD